MTGTPKRQEIDHGRVLRIRVRQRDIDELWACPLNEQLYRAIKKTDPEIRALARSIRKRGIIEPLVVSRDGYIVSGHRRHVAAKVAGLKTVPCRTAPVSFQGGDKDKFAQLLREYNRHRDKGFEEKLREEIVSAEKKNPYAKLVEHRIEASELPTAETMNLPPVKERSVISDAKASLLNAVVSVINAVEEYWPISDRYVHYHVLNDPPLIHASKPGSVYRNDKKSWKALIDILTRGRLEDYIPWDAIRDDTRPMVIFNVHTDTRDFVRGEIDGFCDGYYRDLLQSQENHIEIIGEKVTLAPIIRKVAARFTMPMTLGRGYCCLDRRYLLAERFKDSGKRKLVMLFLADLDPDGHLIAESFARSMRDDFDIWEEDMVPIRVALNEDQTYDLPPGLALKQASGDASRATKVATFKRLYGVNNGWELEAMDPEDLQEILTNAIISVLNVDAFNAEIKRQAEDWKSLGKTRDKMRHALSVHMPPNGDAKTTRKKRRRATE